MRLPQLLLVSAAVAALAALAAPAAAREAAGPARPLTIDDILAASAAAPVGRAVAAVAQEPAAPQPGAAPDEAALPTAPPTDAEILEGRRRPGQTDELPPPVRQENPDAVAPPPMESFPREMGAIPDRWRLIEAVGVKSRWWDPYNQNTYKGDRPVFGTNDWFVNLSAISDTVFEPRTFPIPVGVQTTDRPGSIDTFGRATSQVFVQTFLVGASLIKGSTAFKVPELEARVLLAFQDNYVDVPERRVLHVEPSKRSRRNDAFVGVQEAFIDYHLRNVSDRYDFDSLRVGIQPFSTDFRGFLFLDNQLGVRLFGNRDNNRIQYNLAVFTRVEKDTNSGLNDITQALRDDDIFVANVYRQDLPFPGITSQATIVYNRNREKGDIYVDKNGFPQRPALIGNLRGRNYDVVYLGYNTDGRIGRLNLTTSFYAALGEDRNSIFTSRKAKIRSFFAAAEPSMDFDWIRVRASALWASGDGDPYDNKEKGFDAIFENPQFAGADTSYWIRQTIPFAGGGRVIAIQGRNGLLNSLRPSKEEGQSNFNNPGTMLLGVGGDFDVLPELRVSTSVNRIWFENTAIVQALRQEGSIPKALGWDASISAIWRPEMTQNIVFRASAAVFDPAKGFNDLFTNRGRDDAFYSVLLNAILTF